MATDSEGASQGDSGVLMSPEVPGPKLSPLLFYSWGTAAIPRSDADNYAFLPVPR